MYTFSIEALQYRWHLAKRFSEFKELQHALKRLDVGLVPHLPRRTPFRRRVDTAFINDRATALRTLPHSARYVRWFP